MKWFEQREALRRETLNLERGIVVVADAEGIRAEYPDGRKFSIAWAATRRVVVKTNESGPWGMDFWWVLEAEQPECVFPGGATGEDAAREAFKVHLPGFNWNAVIDAVGCTENAEFVCWESQSAG